MESLAENRPRKRKMPGEDFGGQSAEGDDPAKMPVRLVAEEEEEMVGFGVNEEMVAEVMKWLEREITSPSPSSSGPSFVTINDNDESCGPSFSDSASTVMAAVDTRGAAAGAPFFVGQPPPPEIKAFPSPAAAAWPEVGIVTSPASTAKEEEEDDEGWLARVLCGAGFELEQTLLS